jgi:hypothetical protein
MAADSPSCFGRRAFAAVALLCVLVLAAAPVVEVVHKHNGASRDCSICHVAHIAPNTATSPTIVSHQPEESVLAVLTVEHRPFFLTENISVRPPPHS